MPYYGILTVKLLAVMSTMTYKDNGVGLLAALQ